MPEFEYRGYRIRTLYENAWKIKTWPPVRPARLIDSAGATRDEGERACERRAKALIDSVLAKSRDKSEPLKP